MAAISPMLAKEYKNQDPTGWWMSEKLDGVRAIWDGQALWSRTGKPIYAPLAWLAKLPKTLILDGELWMGRGAFQQLVSCVRKKVPKPADWLGVSYMVFDCIPGFQTPFWSRQQLLADLYASGDWGFYVLPQTVCTDRDHFDRCYDAALLIQGEGVMLRDPESMYENKRSSKLLKRKATYTIEAEVTGYQAGEGKHAGRVGALQCKMGDVEFDVGTGLTDKERENPPAFGAMITVEHKGLTNAGIPRHPVFVCERDYE